MRQGYNIICLDEAGKAFLLDVPRYVDLFNGEKVFKEYAGQCLRCVTALLHVAPSRPDKVKILPQVYFLIQLDNEGAWEKEHLQSRLRRSLYRDAGRAEEEPSPSREWEPTSWELERLRQALEAHVTSADDKKETKPASPTT